ncbi:hypothetical protein [Pelagimonas varians]|uniref:Uncharacterized protein n=1 Tax=Pelagimonas varians TaxID=696760 RepID=A0A238JZC6_9RHOB|nr:hypothetical protein [Pelagimonas varians]PYG33024.1 hypothetical protein C8N36_10218 [Pelagimonas varians]SMX35484.1 hypothetical protein PEV8663_00480 [Pelagimonas varians]
MSYRSRSRFCRYNTQAAHGFLMAAALRDERLGSYVPGHANR